MQRGRQVWTMVISVAAMAMATQPAHASAAAQPGNGEDRDRALQCMALAIAYEAGSEPREGQQAVGEVILSRTRHPAYPQSVCGVVFQGSQRRTGCQFTFTCDGAMRRALNPRTMATARDVAREVLDGQNPPRMGGATHYHANYVNPYWAPSLIRLGRIGAHIFYRAPGSADGPARYVGTAEPVIAALGQWLTAIDPLTQGARTATRHAEAPTPESNASVAPPVFAPWGLAVR